jgi:hypothetical protein
MFLFCSHGVKPPFQAALDPDPGKFGVLRGQGRQRRDLGMALFPMLQIRIYDAQTNAREEI